MNKWCIQPDKEDGFIIKCNPRAKTVRARDFRVFFLSSNATIEKVGEGFAEIVLGLDCPWLHAKCMSRCMLDRVLFYLVYLLTSNRLCEFCRNWKPKAPKRLTKITPQAPPPPASPIQTRAVTKKPTPPKPKRVRRPKTLKKKPTKKEKKKQKQPESEAEDTTQSSSVLVPFNFDCFS